MSTDQPALAAPDDSYVLTAAQVAAIRAEAVDLGAPQAPTEVDRPDGLPGYTEQLANAELLPGGPVVAAARHRLDKARANGAHPDEIGRLQRELADVAGYRLREHDQQLPTAGDGPVIHELVVADVMNRLAIGVKRYGQPLRAHNGRSFLRDAYEEVLDLAAYLRGAIEEEEARLRATADADVPEPPRLHNGNVAVVEGAAWQWRDREWHPLITAADFAGLDPEQLAAIREHAGDVLPAETGASRP